MINHIKLIPPCPKNKPLYEYLVEEITRQRGNINNLFYRVISNHRLQILLQTGNDRDSISSIGNASNEEDIMKDMGFLPNGFNNKLFTWVSPFDKSLNGLGRDITIAIYDGNELELLFRYQAKNGKTYYTNGFAKFKNNLSQYNALIAAYTENNK